VSGRSENRQTAGLQSLHIVARMFAVFSFVLALLALLSFWPPKSPVVVAWLVLWIAICLATSIAILRRAPYSLTLVWTLNILAGLSALAALNSGLLRGVGILIVVLLFVPLVWFAIWYQRHRRVQPASRPTRS
jgi:hypothetical protein